MSDAGKAAMARAAMAAVEPLVELLLELGITSPEAESLLRSVFVHKAREWLSRDRQARGSPSDVRISLVTGVHRNFVRSILAEPPGIAAAREQKGHRAGRVLEAWHSDPRYLDSSGKPRDLSEKDQEPSFFTLASTCVPGAAPSVVLEELRRAGLVQMLSEHRVRARSRIFRLQGVNAATISELGYRARTLLSTLVHNLRHPDSRLYCEAMPTIQVDATKAAFARDLIVRRAANFLAALEQDLTVEARSARHRRLERVTIGLTVIESGP
ncbi:MAG TPA: DUF6502 family protein [Steroidobacteraceae bacterium]